MRLWHAVLPALLISCVHNPPNTSGIYATAPQVVVPDESGNAQPLAGGTSLQSGQVFGLVIELQEPAHVYVIHRHGGVLDGLYPGVGAADAQLSPGLVRLPSQDSWMRVPRLDRQSRLCVLLSTYPIDSQHRRCPHEGAHQNSHGHQPGGAPVQPFTISLTP